MNKLKQALITTITVSLILWAFLALFQTLVPWVNELSGEAEREEKAKLDAESCPGTEYKIVDDVLYCDYLGRLVKPKYYKRIIK